MNKPKRSSFAYASQEMQARLSTTYGELFDVCDHKHHSNEQSQAAFQSIKDRLNQQQTRVLRAIANSDDGLTCDEIAIVLGATPNEISPRCSELKRDHKIVESGRRFTRKGKCTAAILKLA